MLRLYYSNITELSVQTQHPVSEYRREKLAGIKTELGRKQSLGAELLLNHALKEWEGDIPVPAEIVCGEYGKPELKGKELQFSLSHCGDYAVCAVSDKALGVDIQKLEYREAVADRFYTEDERRYISREEDRALAFTRIWTEKESYLKLLGTGLNKALSSFSVFEAEAFFVDFKVGDYYISVCTSERQVDIIPEYIELS